MTRPSIHVISNAAIRAALAEMRRQYLAGRLDRPQLLQHFDTSLLEIGISSYQNASEEQPHTHRQAFEFQWVLRGFTEYLDLDTREVAAFRKGDFYVIEPGVRYAQKTAANTEILFIKAPAGNDKVVVDPDAFVRDWLEHRIESRRKDHFHSPEAPPANSMRPAASVAVFDQGQILLLRRRDSGNWTMPGGTLEYDETLLDCARREVLEETGLRITITALIGTYTDPQVVIEYLDGEVRREFTLVYLAECDGRTVMPDSESTEASWFTMAETVGLPMATSQRQRVADAFAFVNDRTVRLR